MSNEKKKREKQVVKCKINAVVASPAEAEPEPFFSWSSCEGCYLELMGASDE